MTADATPKEIMMCRLHLVGISIALLAGVFATRAAAQQLNCTAARVTPASSIRIGPGAQSFSFDIDGGGQANYQCNWGACKQRRAMVDDEPGVLRPERRGRILREPDRQHR